MKKKDESRWRKSNWQDSIPIHDENAKSRALNVLKEGGAIGIFPEGTRNKTMIFTLASYIQNFTILIREIRQEKEIQGILIVTEETISICRWFDYFI